MIHWMRNTQIYVFICDRCRYLCGQRYGEYTRIQMNEWIGDMKPVGGRDSCRGVIYESHRH
jgi:hypothetical protein